MASRKRILVVEDEDSIRRGLIDVLDHHGHEAASVASGEAGLELLVDPEAGFDLVLLDVMLPGLSGFELCRRLRADSRTEPVPVLMLTAKGSEDDVVEGLEAGADDYVTKPFSIRELMARVDALLRRSAGARPAGETLTFGTHEVDRGSLTATSNASGQACTVDLTPRELALIELFHRERGRILSRRTLLQEVWDMRSAADVETRTVDVHVGKLRKKLGADGELIETVRGAGYRYRGGA